MVLGAAVAAPSAEGVTADGDEAAAYVSQYRASRGLPGVTVDFALTKIAVLHARRMAAANRLAHELPGQGSFAQRLSAGGFAATLAVENIAGGPRSVAEALALWRRSPPHDRNLLAAGVSKLGIGVATARNGRYKTYWTLILGQDGAGVDNND